MRTLRLLAIPTFAIALIGCGNTSTGSTGDPTAQAPPDGITLTSATHNRLTGAYADAAGNLLRFDTAKVDDNLYFDLTGIGGRQIIHIETVGDN